MEPGGKQPAHRCHRHQRSVALLTMLEPAA